MNKATVLTRQMGPVPSPPAPQPRRAPRSVIVSTWAIPIMVVGQFAFLAFIPAAIMLNGTFRDPRSRDLRGWVSALGIVYAVPFLMWVLNPGRAESLSKDIAPVFVGLIVAAAALVLLKIYTQPKR